MLAGNKQNGMALSVVLMILVVSTLLVTGLFQVYQSEPNWIKAFHKQQALYNADALLQWKKSSLSQSTNALDSFPELEQSFMRTIPKPSIQVDSALDWVRIEASASYRKREAKVEAWFGKRLNKTMWQPALRIKESKELEFAQQIEGQIIKPKDSTSSKEFDKINAALSSWVTQAFSTSKKELDEATSDLEKEAFSVLQGSYRLDPSELRKRSKKKDLLLLGGDLTLENRSRSFATIPKGIRILVEGNLVLEGNWELSGTRIFVGGKINVEGNLSGWKNHLFSVDGFAWKGEGSCELSLMTGGIELSEKATLQGNSIVAVTGNGAEKTADGAILLKGESKIRGWVLNFATPPQEERSWAHIRIEANASIEGIVWTSGAMFLQGNIEGSVGVRSMECLTEGRNCVAGGSIESDKLPFDLLSPIGMSLGGDETWVAFDWKIL